MATTSHTIYSHYDRVEQKSTNYTRDSLDNSELDAWHFDPSFRPRPPHPRFVPASRSAELTKTVANDDHAAPSIGKDVSSWYRSLHSPSGGDASLNALSENKSQPSTHCAITQPQPVCLERFKDKNNWFIMKAIQSGPIVSQPAPSPSLAEIITRDPPPLPSEPRYHPPVWLEIGPSNKGFEMLQRTGWSEGEPLGPDVARRHRSPDSSRDALPWQGSHKMAGSMKERWHDVKIERHGDMSELVDVIDLTESDLEDDATGLAITSKVTDAEDSDSPAGPDASYSRTALVTPLPTVLKSDRLGVGFKAKTVGPHKASLRRVTHNVAALAAHIKRSEEVRKRVREVGRGRRAFAKQREREEAERRKLLAYVNS